MLLFYLVFIFAQAPDTLWTRAYGSASCDMLRCVRQTADNGYILTGCTPQPDPNYFYDLWYLKLNARGDVLWDRTLSWPLRDLGYSVIQTGDGGYAIAGTTNSFGTGFDDILIVKTDPDGDTVWTRVFGGENNDHGYEVIESPDQGLVVVGVANFTSIYDYDMCLIKLDAAGNLLWEKIYDGLFAWSIDQTFDGGYAIAGYTRCLSNGYGLDDVFLMKTDSSGDSLWLKLYGDESVEYGYSVKQTASGGFIIAGETHSYGAYWADIYLVKTDANGDPEWIRNYDPSGYHDLARSVLETWDRGYVVAGYSWLGSGSGSDIYLMKTDEFGDSVWTGAYGGNSSDLAFSLQKTNDGGYVIAGHTWSFGAGNEDGYIVKTFAKTDMIEDDAPGGSHVKGAPVYCPTVYSGSLQYLCSLKNCKIFDIAGRKVNPASPSLAPGVYFVEIDGKINGKVIKVR